MKKLLLLFPVQLAYLQVQHATANPQPEAFDAICNHDKKREQHCKDESHQWMALLSRSYCCADILGVQEADPGGCYWRDLFLQHNDRVFGEFKSLQHGGIRTGLECQHACLSNPDCKTWSYVFGGGTEISRLCFLISEHLEQVPKEAVLGFPGAISGRRCSCKSCETSYPKELILSQLPQHSPRSSDETADFLNAMSRNGFYVLKKAISDELADRVLKKATKIADDMLSQDKFRLGNRGARRYSLGSAQKTHHLVHEKEWVELLNTERIHKLVDALGSYMIVGGGGDLVLDQTDTHQWLHTDLPREEMYHEASAPALAVNFAVHDVSCEMGSIRVFPGSHRFLFDPVTVGLEKQKLQNAVKFLCPLEKGDAVIRDLRVWHAGSANLDKERVRYFPNIEFLSDWFGEATKDYGDHLSPRKILPKKNWEELIPEAKRKTVKILADDDLEVGLIDNLVLPQPSG